MSTFFWRTGDTVLLLCMIYLPVWTKGT